MKTITKSDIELSERLRRACAEIGITDPRFVAQDENGYWHHYNQKPDDGNIVWASAVFQLLHNDDPPPNWRDTLMEFKKPTIEAGKRYWRRDGLVSNALRQYGAANLLTDGNCVYDMRGTMFVDKESQVDLIAEYSESEPLAEALNRTCAECGKLLA